MKPASFEIDDMVFGHWKFTSPLLVELINSAPVQRLKKINQYGIPDIYLGRKNFTRFDHSIGAAVLVAKHGASEKEQAAAILHDVSHAAFSHVIDSVFANDKEQDIQDKLLHETIETTDIKTILEKHGLNTDDFKHLEDYNLLEQEIPAICADRIDYCLREVAIDGEPKKARKIADALCVAEGVFCFKTIQAAREFALEFARLQKEHWGGNEKYVAQYQLLARAIKAALDSKEVSERMLFRGNDEEIMAILETSKNAQVKKALKDLAENNLPNVSGIKVKHRFVDPLVKTESGPRKLSEINKE